MSALPLVEEDMVAVCRLEGTGLGDTVSSLLDKVQLTVPFVI